MSGDPHYDDNDGLVENFKSALLISFLLPYASSVATGSVVPQIANNVANTKAKKLRQGPCCSADDEPK